MRGWLRTGMFAKETKTAARRMANKVVQAIGSHALTLSHSRHLTREQARDAGLRVEDIEKRQNVQDAILTVHHACVLTLQSTNAFKIIENHLGSAHILSVQPTVHVGA